MKAFLKVAGVLWGTAGLAYLICAVFGMSHQGFQQDAIQIALAVLLTYLLYKDSLFEKACNYPTSLKIIVTLFSGAAIGTTLCAMFNLLRVDYAALEITFDLAIGSWFLVFARKPQSNFLTGTAK